MKSFFSILFFLIILKINAQIPLSCNAGNDAFICQNGTALLNANINGGAPPFTFQWEPAGFCNSPNNISTSVNLPYSVNFTLTVIDNNDDTCIDFVTVFVNDIYKFGAGQDKHICYLGGAPVDIGDQDNYQGNYTYTWLPVSNLSNPTAPNPISSPSVTTTFTLTVNSPACGFITDQVTVFVHKVDPDAGNPVTINQGETTTLNATGGASYFWTPPFSIKYSNTASPDVFPNITTTYTVQALDEYGCSGYDTVTVYVNEFDGLIFYNTFTPNGDGENDTWVIPNISKYPDNVLEIYNRYGQLIFRRSGYNNEWDGKYFGQELPTGTYFYYLNTRTEKGTYKGSVTIMR
ncbi:MAG: gliding motility-associated C-terminal domain-containing protein [Bacteroidota bacterium]|jgi:gliding motility-associated-like protein